MKKDEASPSFSDEWASAAVDSVRIGLSIGVQAPSINSFRFVPLIYDPWDDFQVVRTSSRCDLHSLELELENRKRQNNIGGERFTKIARIRTLYKKKADKVLPINSSSSDRSIPRGLSN